MRNDYIGFGLLKDVSKYKQKVLNTLINESMTIEEKTQIRIEINNLSYKELLLKTKKLGL